MKTIRTCSAWSDQDRLSAIAPYPAYGGISSRVLPVRMNSMLTA
jgi:hypothetical protein